MGRVGCRLEGSYYLSWRKRQKRKVVHRGKGGKRPWCRGHILFGEWFLWPGELVHGMREK